MSLPRSLAWSLGLIALCALNAPAWSAQQGSKAATAPSAASAATSISLLAGKLRFSLPSGYESAALPPGDASNGTAGAEGTLYMNEAQKRIVVVTEMPLQSALDASKAENDAFLASASQGFISRQAQGLPDFHQTGEKRVSLNGLAAQQIDATATIGGGKTLTTYFMAGAGPRMAIVQVISRETDRAGHDAVLQRIASGAAR